MDKCVACREISIQTVESAVKEAYEKTKGVTRGKNASYIPYLANVDSNLFAICMTLGDGTQIKVGDVDSVFGIESISKVPTAILAMTQSGADAVLEKIGANATGMPFNSITAILLENDSASTPLVNAGAIAACSMIEPKGDPNGKWEAICQNMSDMAGSDLTLIDELYKSESDTDFNNKSIAWLLKNYGRIYDDPDMSLDLYTRQCSMGVTTEQLSIMAATIAFDGRNPITGKQAFPNALADKATSLISTVGFYQNTGNWIFKTGIPAKSGVGGGVLGVMPGLFGIAAFAPPLDEAGNSVKAQDAIQFIMEKLGLSIFSGSHICHIA